MCVGCVFSHYLLKQFLVNQMVEYLLWGRISKVEGVASTICKGQSLWNSSVLNADKSNWETDTPFTYMQVFTWDTIVYKHMALFWALSHMYKWEGNQVVIEYILHHYVSLVTHVSVRWN